MGRQQFRPTIAAGRVRRFAAEESLICLAPPPFHTVWDEVADGGDVGGFWSRFGALHEIAASLSLVIGDFGLGSDAPVVLNYAANWHDPPVYRLRWNSDRTTNWVRGAGNFDEFVAMLGLAASNG